MRSPARHKITISPRIRRPCGASPAAHDGDDLFDLGRIGGVALALVARRSTGMESRHRRRRWTSTGAVELFGHDPFTLVKRARGSGETSAGQRHRRRRGDRRRSQDRQKLQFRRPAHPVRHPTRWHSPSPPERQRTHDGDHRSIGGSFFFSMQLSMHFHAIQAVKQNWTSRPDYRIYAAPLHVAP